MTRPPLDTQAGRAGARTMGALQAGIGSYLPGEVRIEGPWA
jgi:hypothetical protein